jgi:hypothetical protein
MKRVSNLHVPLCTTVIGMLVCSVSFADDAGVELLQATIKSHQLTREAIATSYCEYESVTRPSAESGESRVLAKGKVWQKHLLYKRIFSWGKSSFEQLIRDGKQQTLESASLSASDATGASLETDLSIVPPHIQDPWSIGLLRLPLPDGKGFTFLERLVDRARTKTAKRFSENGNSGVIISIQMPSEDKKSTAPDAWSMELRLEDRYHMLVTKAATRLRLDSGDVNEQIFIVESFIEGSPGCFFPNKYSYEAKWNGKT